MQKLVTKEVVSFDVLILKNIFDDNRVDLITQDRVSGIVPRVTSRYLASGLSPSGQDIKWL